LRGRVLPMIFRGFLRGAWSSSSPARRAPRGPRRGR
jgi:hypothetical protein